MYVFGEIEKSSTIIENNLTNYTQNLSASSAGIQSIKVVSGSINDNYWQSLNVLFYTSGSPEYINEHKFGRPGNNINISRLGGTKHLHKFHGYPSSSILTVPQQYYGQKIKEKTFKFTATSYTDFDGNNPTIKDEGFGNLYSTNAHHSQSVTHPSSSGNYVGNIFYEQGLAVITETGSWSGSVNYSDLANDKNFTLEIGSYNTIRTHEYSVTIEPNDFNHSMNWTMRLPLSGTYSSMEEFTGSLLSTPYLAADFTGSDFSPYITTINLYQAGDIDTPVAIATFPRPIKKSKKILTTFKIKLDF